MSKILLLDLVGDWLLDLDENKGKTDDEIEEIISALPWKKAIFVNVGLPDSL